MEAWIASRVLFDISTMFIMLRHSVRITLTKPCFILLNNFNHERFHCLFTNQSTLWKSYSVTKSCDIPEHFYDLIELSKLLGTDYVLPFTGHFRESSGYTIGMYRQTVDLYPASRIDRTVFKYTVYAMIVFLCVISHRLGGTTPNMKLFSFVYTNTHPVLCDIGAYNAEVRERLSHRAEHFNDKKWSRFMTRKTIRDVVRYLRIIFPTFFQKKKTAKRCVLNEPDEEGFDDETHRLVCQSDQKSLIQVLAEYSHLMPRETIQTGLIQTWVDKFKDKMGPVQR
ncbi:uncharacterized protein CEXT_54971 [Caerostris extrusa]|uniref:Uncharacterized protein n=1 Tax=Caerostris extrusa TaxID=172846 RepID=A0AAV4VVS1_CAEEX|nr:uncharacterized protein CEXT_54971 [Caerostris extrusa]